MNITKIAAGNKPLTYTMLLFFMVMGLVSYLNMPRNSMPPFLVRFVSIVTRFPGASPERVEQLVTVKIEEVVQEVPEVDFIASESRTGISIVSVAIKESETVLQPIFDEIRRKVDGIRDDLPEGTVGPNVNDEFGDVFGILIGLTADGFSYAELKDVADEVRDELIKLDDAAKVEIVGSQEERIFIDFDHARLAELGLTQSHIQNILTTTNIIYPGGNVVVGNERIILEPTGNFESVEDLRRTLVTTGSATLPVYLGDITHIYRGYIDPPDSIVTINGHPGLVLGISLKDGGNIIDLGEKVDATIARIRGVYPHGIDFERVASQDIVVRDSVDNFIGNLMQAVVVVLAVMLFFLGMRVGLVVASLIPMAIVMGLMLMAMTGIGLDKVSLAALIIALGMLVDNGIVVSESIMVKMEEGARPFDAAIATSRELFLPLLVSTLTTAAAFVAFYLAESTMGEVVGPIFVVVTEVLLASWVLALTIIPMLCVLVIRANKPAEKAAPPSRFRLWYGKLLHRSLQKPISICLLLVFLFFGSLVVMAMWVPFIFMPVGDRNLVYADIELPLGTDIERTVSVCSAIDRFLAENLRVAENRPHGALNWSAYVGRGAPKYDLGYSPSEGASHSAHFIINTSSSAENSMVMEALENWCVPTFPEMTLTVARLTTGGGSADPIAIRISGKQPDRLYAIVDEVKARLQAIEGTKNVRDDWGMRTKKLVVAINQAKAKLAGVSNYDVAQSLRTMLSGQNTGQFREGDKVIPIVMRSARDHRLEIDALESLNIFAQSSGRNVPLKQVADISVVWQASKIKRRDLNKNITVTAALAPGVTAREVMAQLQPWLEQAAPSWGSGYQYALGGETEDSSKAMGAVIVNLPIAFFVIVLLLLGQFGSVRKVVIILLTIPLGFIGVVMGLLIGNSYFGFFAFLGIISLAGIVINNGIVLLDRIEIELGVPDRAPIEAIIAAAQQRFRPIMLTTATTSLGLIPLWLGGGPMFEPMAIAIMFGLIFATVITLIFVPVLYKMLFRIT